MPDLEDRLRSSAHAWQQAVDDGAQPSRTTLAEASRPDPRARVLAPMASVLAVLLVVVGVIIETRSAQRRAPAGGTRTVTYVNLRFEIPADWRVVTPSFAPLGPTSALGYWTNAGVGSQCNSRGCGAPVDALSNGQFLVVVDAQEPLGRATYSTTVAGFPAMITNSRGPHDCLPGTVEHLDVTIRTRGDLRLGLHGCFATDTDAAQRAFEQALDTARHA